MSLVTHTVPGTSWSMLVKYGIAGCYSTLFEANDFKHSEMTHLQTRMRKEKALINHSSTWM
jgi:hypothetical protein